MSSPTFLFALQPPVEAADLVALQQGHVTDDKAHQVARLPSLYVGHSGSSGATRVLKLVRSVAVLTPELRAQILFALSCHNLTPEPQPEDLGAAAAFLDTHEGGVIFSITWDLSKSLER